MEKQLTTKRSSERKKRVPLNSRNRLAVKDQDPNYVYRIVNANLDSDPDRVERFQEAGYEIVPASKAGQVGDNAVDTPSALGSAGLISVGKGTKAIVMRQLKEDYLEDQRRKEADLKETELRAKRSADYGSLDITVKRTPD